MSKNLDFWSFQKRLDLAILDLHGDMVKKKYAETNISCLL